jgi:hypothetical protein
VLALSTTTVASASTGFDASETTGAHPAAATATTTNFIWNVSAIGIGAIHVHDGNYTHGAYDALLSSGASTDLEFNWASAAGWYTGPGYCTALQRSDDLGLHWSHQDPLGPGQWFIGAHTSYMVSAYRC